MPTVSLTSFLKILSKGTPQKVQEYSKYLAPGGYDFYWRLKDAATDLTVHGKSLAECSTSIEAIRNEVERKHNAEGLKALSNWLSGSNFRYFQPPTGKCTSPRGFVSVRLEPEFGIIDADKRRMIHLWNSKGAELKPLIAGIGIHLMQQHLCVGQFADCTAALLDLRKGRLLVSDRLPANVSMMIASEMAWVDGFFEQHQKAA